MWKKIDRLNKENAALRDENNQVKEENARLSSQVRETAEQNESACLNGCRLPKS